MKKNWVLILGTSHRLREPGKQSPDGSLRECVYGREIISELKPIFEDYGIRTFIDFEPLDLEKTMQTPSASLERSRELALRVNEVNRICKEYGKENCLYVSIHNDAIGNDGKWHDANGWSVRVSPKASSNSKILAIYLAAAAEAHGLNVRKPNKNDHSKPPYWEQSLYVLNNTACPAVLTENLFQDNKKDVEFLLSDVGRQTIERIHIEGILNYMERV